MQYTEDRLIALDLLTISRKFLNSNHPPYYHSFFFRIPNGFEIIECTSLKEFEQIFQHHGLFETDQVYVKNSMIIK